MASVMASADGVLVWSLSTSISLTAFAVRVCVSVAIPPHPLFPDSDSGEPDSLPNPTPIVHCMARELP